MPGNGKWMKNSWSTGNYVCIYKILRFLEVERESF